MSDKPDWSGKVVELKNGTVIERDARGCIRSISVKSKLADLIGIKENPASSAVSATDFKLPKVPVNPIKINTLNGNRNIRAPIFPIGKGGLIAEVDGNGDILKNNNSSSKNVSKGTFRLNAVTEDGKLTYRGFVSVDGGKVANTVNHRVMLKPTAGTTIGLNMDKNGKFTAVDAKFQVPDWNIEATVSLVNLDKKAQPVLLIETLPSPTSPNQLALAAQINLATGTAQAGITMRF